MYDIKGKKDIELNQFGDLILEKTPGSLFEKAIVSPKGYIAIEYSPNEYIDENYGNAVYYKLGENLNNNLLSDITTDVRDAASYVNVPTSSIDASVDSLSTINYLIRYTDENTQGITINV